MIRLYIFRGHNTQQQQIKRKYQAIHMYICMCPPPGNGTNGLTKSTSNSIYMCANLFSNIHTSIYIYHDATIYFFRDITLKQTKQAKQATQNVYLCACIYIYMHAHKYTFCVACFACFVCLSVMSRKKYIVAS